MQAYGLAHLWQQGDFITRAVAIILLLMSVLSWTVMIIKIGRIFQFKRLTKNAENEFWHAENFKEGIEKLNSFPGNPYILLALEGEKAMMHYSPQANEHRELHSALQAPDWLMRCLRNAMDEIIARLQSGLAILASIGSTAPFVGLLGTVWGIYHALLAIGISGQTSIDQVAGPVGEALIMTAFGLFVAIPAVLGYNALTRANKSIATQLNRFTHSLQAYFLTGSNKSVQI